MTADVADAQREAEQAQEAAEAAESGLSSGQRTVTFDAFHRLRDRVRHADAAAAGARAKAERERVKARTAALEELAARIDAIAPTAGARIAETLTEMAGLATRLREQAAEWDAAVAELAATAMDLGATAPAAGGPRPADSEVAVSPDMTRVWHARTVVQAVSDQVGPGIAYAVAGDAVSAVAAVRASLTVPKPERADHYLRGAGGMVFTWNDPLPRVIAAQLRSGQVTELPESEIIGYLNGAA